MIRRDFTGNNILSIAGAITVVSSVIMFVFFLFSLSVGCSFVTSFFILIPSFFFILGVIVFFLGVVLSKKRRRISASTNSC